MNGLKLDILDGGEADIDLLQCRVDQIGTLLDLVRFERFLDYIYVILLKREADREGQAYYQELARKGVTRPAIVKRLLRSREYRISSVEGPGLEIDEFVNRSYQDILGRWPDQEGLTTYRRIAAKPNGRRKVLANLRESDEALRKGGGRLAKIEALRGYARTGWCARLPGIGSWFAARRKHRQRLDRIALNQCLLAHQVASLREELETVSMVGAEPFGFATESSGCGEAQDGGRAAVIFQNALIRARREA